MRTTDSASYTATAKVLHWVIAWAIIIMLALGWCFDYFPKEGGVRFAAIQFHKSLGITILLLSFIRLGWRLTHSAPPLPDTMSVWEKRAAHFGHFLLYVLMIGMPLTGWAMVSASPRGLPTILYGVVTWPNMPFLSTLDNKKEVSDFFRDMHCYVAYILAATVVGHAAAAWKHHLFSKDDILLRMAPNCFAGFLNKLRGQK